MHYSERLPPAAVLPFFEHTWSVNEASSPGTALYRASAEALAAVEDDIRSRQSRNPEEKFLKHALTLSHFCERCGNVTDLPRSILRLIVRNLALLARKVSARMIAMCNDHYLVAALQIRPA